MTTETFKEGIKELDRFRNYNNKYTKYDLSKQDVNLRHFTNILLNMYIKREIEITEENLPQTYDIMVESYRENSTINSKLPNKEDFITYITNLVF